MQVTVEQTNPCTLVLDIAVDEQQVARAFDSVYREFSRYTNVPGFRPGKAPRALLERYVNREKVRERTLEKLITDSFPKAIEQEGITPFRSPDIEPTDLEDSKPYSYKATVPLEPQVTLGEYTGLTIEKPLYPITDDLVAHRLQQLREERARLDRVTDRGVQEGDVLIAENQVVMEGEEATAARRQLIQIGNNIPGFDEAVMGMRPDEERTFELTYPEDFDEEAKRGKKAIFTLKLSSISAKKLPELDDAFAKDVGNVDTVDELRQRMKERMEADAARLSNEIAEQRIIQEIVHRAETYFPDVLVREEAQHELNELSKELRQRNMTYPQYLEQIGKSPEEHQAGVAEQAAQRVRTVLALRQVAVQEGLQPDEQAIDAEFDRLLQAGSIDEEQYREFRSSPQRRLQVANALIQQQLHDFLFANNTIHEVVQETSVSTAASEEAAEETPKA